MQAGLNESENLDLALEPAGSGEKIRSKPCPPFTHHLGVMAQQPVEIESLSPQEIDYIRKSIDEVRCVEIRCHSKRTVLCSPSLGSYSNISTYHSSV